MPFTRRTLLAATFTGLLARPALIRAQTSTPIRIGEINSYATQIAVNQPYRKGWELALSQLNDRGGLDGRKVEILSRDDGGTPEGAVRAATELVNDDKVDLLAGGYTSEVGLAISAYALRTKKLYIASEPLTDDLVWAKGNRYTYHIRPTTFMLAAMLVQTALTLPAKTYVTVAPNDDFGRSAVKWFRQLLSARRPDVRFVGEQWPAPGQIDTAALAQLAPDAIFCALVGTDLLTFIRQGNNTGLFDKRLVVSMLTGDPETLLALGDDAPVGWLVTGYPWSMSDEPDNKQFALDYTLKYNEPPGMGSVIGVSMVNAITSGVLKSGGTDTEKMADGFADATFNTPFGICRLRGIDHQSTLGTYVGRTTKQNGHGGMVDWGYVDGATVLPPDDVVRTLRTG
jgi:branched-chain amino acid transport system substrate-binding protein